MSEPIVITQRDDTSILEDIYHLLATYPPLANDRHAIHVSVSNGAVVISGHVMTTNTRRFFLSRLNPLDLSYRWVGPGNWRFCIGTVTHSFC